ncbi:MAG: Co2+/Mg2+ efflux protein ApaG [Bacteroidota bacterium]
METLITAGVEVQVDTVFQPEQSNEMSGVFLFAYHITLLNHNNFTVQLISRKWKITDSTFDVRHVEGEGVIGRQPVLYPGDSYQYVSACDLASPVGKMEGTYIFENKESGKKFEVQIPSFKLIAPVILN